MRSPATLHATGRVREPAEFRSVPPPDAASWLLSPPTCEYLIGQCAANRLGGPPRNAVTAILGRLNGHGRRLPLPGPTLGLLRAPGPVSWPGRLRPSPRRRNPAGSQCPRVLAQPRSRCFRIGFGGGERASARGAPLARASHVRRGRLWPRQLHLDPSWKRNCARSECRCSPDAAFAYIGSSGDSGRCSQPPSARPIGCVRVRRAHLRNPRRARPEHALAGGETSGASNRRARCRAPGRRAR